MYLSLVFSLALFLLPQGLPDLVDGVERSFARMKDLSSDFIQIFQDSLNRKQQESGHLYLMRPRMMRWEYKTPEDKVFVSDGKTVYVSSPAFAPIPACARPCSISRYPRGSKLFRDWDSKFHQVNMEFNCKYAKASGEVLTAVVVGQSIDEVRHHLQEQGFLPINIRPRGWSLSFRSQKRRQAIKD